MKRLLLFLLIAAFALGQGQNFVATVPINAQTGTTYTVAGSDFAKLVTFSNGGAIAVTLPQAGTVGLNTGWYVYVENIGVGTATITPTTSTIDGAASLALLTNQGAMLVSNGTNYATVRGVGGVGTGCSNTSGTMTCTSFATNSSNGGITAVEGTGAGLTPVAGSDLIYASSGTHRLMMNNNNGGAVTIMSTSDVATGAQMPVATISDLIGGYGSGILVGAASTAAISTANQVRAVRFDLFARIAITKIDFRIGTGVAASFVGAGIYNSDGTTLLVDSGAVDTSTNGVKTTTVGSVTLQPGTYWFAYTANTATTLTGILGPSALSDTALSTAGAGKIGYGTAANASVAGQLPSTLGAVTLANFAPLLVHFY